LHIGKKALSGAFVVYTFEEMQSGGSNDMSSRVILQFFNRE